MIFVIAIFRKESLQWIINALQSISENLANSAVKSLEAQRKVLHEPSVFKDNKPLFARLWDIFIIGMIIFFLKSIVDADVQEKAIQISSNNEIKPHTE